MRRLCDHNFLLSKTNNNSLLPRKQTVLNLSALQEVKHHSVSQIGTGDLQVFVCNVHQCDLILDETKQESICKNSLIDKSRITEDSDLETGVNPHMGTRKQEHTGRKMTIYT